MSTSEMSQEEANKLFAQVSQAVLADDGDKLSTLLEQDTPEDKEQPVVDPPADTPEEEEEVEEVDTDSDDKDDKEDKSADVDEADSETDKDEEDPLTKLRAEIETLRKEQQVIKSQTGRISAVQRRLSQYDKQLAELTQSTSSQTVEKVRPKIDETLKELDVTDPALAKTLRAVVEQALSGVASESNAQQIEQIQALRDADYEVYREEQVSALLDKYPNAVQVFNSPHWAEWKKSQPKHIVDLATSDSAEAVSMALERYREDMIRLHPELANAKDKSDNAEKEVEVNARAQQIEEERKRQQQNAANVNSGKPPARSKEPADPEALFKQFFNTELKNITGK